MGELRNKALEEAFRVSRFPETSGQSVRSAQSIADEIARRAVAAHHAKVIAAVEGLQGSEPDEKPEGGPTMYENEHGDWLHRAAVLAALASLAPEGK